jgi:hypothetical protein
LSRFNSSGSKQHSIQYLGTDLYRLYWVMDRYVKNSRLRFPTTYTRDTDLRGAQRFAKKWALLVPRPSRSPAHDR